MGAAPDPRFPLRVASIDVGSNGIRCMAAEFHDADTYELVLQERASVRLGHSVFLDGAIDMEAMEAAIAALTGFKGQLDAANVHHVRAVATSAVREAKNGDQFVKRARKQAGIEVETITGGEEARLVFGAVRRRLPMDGTWMLMDLGGGSVEVSLANGKGLQRSESYPMGSVRLLEEFQACRGDTKRFQRLIAETVEALRLPGTRSKVQGLAATGGNIEDLARIAGDRDSETKVTELAVKDLRKALARLADLDERERIKEFGLRPDRADVILPAGLVYEQVAKLAGVDTIHVPHVGLKEGVLYDLVDGLAVNTDPRARKETLVRDGSITLGRRYEFDEDHGIHVARLALSLFDQTRSEHGLGESDRAVLHAAAILHDVGRFVGDRKHHKHSYYLLSQAELPGLSEPETEIAAQVARYHRRKEPTIDHAPFAKLSAAERERVSRLAALLRVADALDSEHRQAVRTVTVRRDKGLTLLDLQGSGDFALEEWSVHNKGGLFSRVFATSLEVRKEAPA